MMIPVTLRIAIAEEEVQESFIRASGPGGQNVHKLETAVQLRFDVRGSPNLPEAVKARMETLAGRRLTQEGVLVLTAQTHRTRERNRADALERLLALIREAALPPPPPRRPTKPSKRAKAKRMDEKSGRAEIKRGRAKPVAD